MVRTKQNMGEKVVLNQYIIEDAKVDGYIYPLKINQKEKRARLILKCFMEDFRMSLTEMSRKTKISVSTLHGYLKELRTIYDFKVVLVKKNQGGESNDSANGIRP